MGNLPLTLHNRWFDPATEYLQMGFRDSFIVEQENQCALPIKEDVFLYIMGKAKSWGMVTYEQDWLVTTYGKMNATQSSVTNVANWLGAMDSSATSLSLTVQYCMALPLHILASVQYPSVTQIRATTDYQPGNAQWRIQYGSQFIWALGSVPFKDTFWSGDGVQAGCPPAYGTCIEPNPSLHTIVASLSAGPVGPSDFPSKLNKTRLSWVAASDGKLIKVDYPVRPLELGWDGIVDSKPVLLDLMMTETGSRVLLLAANLPYDVPIRPDDLDPYFPVGTYVVFDWLAKRVVGTSNQSKPFVLLAAKNYVTVFPDKVPTPVEFNFYVLTPQDKVRRWLCIGDVSKIAVASKLRLGEVKEIYTEDAIVAHGNAPIGDSIHFGMYDLKAERFQILQCHSIVGQVKAQCFSDGSCRCLQ
jgi:hypothetical protein